MRNKPRWCGHWKSSKLEREIKYFLPLSNWDWCLISLPIISHSKTMQANWAVSVKQQTPQNTGHYALGSSLTSAWKVFSRCTYLEHTVTFMYYWFPSLPPIKPLHLLSTGGKEEFSALLPNILITSNTFRFSCTNCVSHPATTWAAEPSQDNVEFKRLLLPPAASAAIQFIHSAPAQMVHLSQMFFGFKEVLSKKKMQISGRYDTFLIIFSWDFFLFG